MKNVIARSLVTAVTVGLVVMAGCAPSTPQRDGPPTHPVSGTVTLGGKPVAGATIRFELVDGSKSASGRTDDQGKYTLSTFAANDGALAGDYKVTVIKMEGGAGGEAVSEDDPNYTGAPEPGAAEAKNVLPEKYASADTSELTATVAAGNNTFDFPLE